MPTQFMRLGYDAYTLDEENFYNLTADGTPAGKPIGWNVDVRLNYYRGMPLSSVEALELSVDGRRVPEEKLRFRIHGKAFAVADLKELWAENWALREAAHLEAFDGGLSPGEHTVELTLHVRNVYMRFAPRVYGKVDAGAVKTMALKRGPSRVPKLMPAPDLAVRQIGVDGVGGIDFGISLYGFTERLYGDGAYGLEGMFQDLVRLGVKKFETIGAQVFPGYPYVTDAEAAEFRALAEKYGLEPFSYGAYVDYGVHSDRDLTDEEIVASVTLELETAKRLGCSYVRGGSMPAHLWPRLARIAEERGVRLGYEVHAPETPTTPHILEMARMFEEIDSPFVGFIPDFGCFIERPNRISIERLLAQGAKREILDFIIANRWNGYTFETMNAKVEELGGGLAEKLAVGQWFGFMSFQPADVDGFARILLKRTLYFHGKFYHIDEDLKETTIPYEALLQRIVASGFRGVLLTEYEGHAFQRNDAVQQIARHLAMEREILERL